MKYIPIFDTVCNHVMVNRCNLVVFANAGLMWGFMKKTIYILMVTFLFHSVVKADEVYKTVNPDGSVIYSDIPAGAASTPVKVYPGVDAGRRAEKSNKSTTRVTSPSVVDSAGEAISGNQTNKVGLPASKPTVTNRSSAASKSNSSIGGGGGAAVGASQSGSAISSGGKSVVSPQAVAIGQTAIGQTAIGQTAIGQTAIGQTAIDEQVAMDGELPPKWPWRGVTIDVFGERTDPSSVITLKSKGVNAIELVLSIRNVAQYQNKTTAQAWKEAFIWADKMLDACKTYGIVGIITFVQAPEDPSLQIKQYSPEFWESPKHIDEALISIELLVEHFKNRGSELAAYEFFNEPLIQRATKNETPSNWLEVQDRILKIVRRVDPKRFVVVNPGMGGETLWYRNFVPLDDKRVVYGAHFYNPHEYTHQGIAGRPLGITWPAKVGGVIWNKERLRSQLMPLVLFQKKYNVPVWIGEFSAARWASQSDQWLCDTVSLFNEYGFGWMYFAYNGYHGWNPHFDSVYTSDKKEDWLPHDIGEASSRWGVVKKLLSNGCN